jgi:hypothetical protein
MDDEREGSGETAELKRETPTKISRRLCVCDTSSCEGCSVCEVSKVGMRSSGVDHRLAGSENGSYGDRDGGNV